MKDSDSQSLKGDASDCLAGKKSWASIQGSFMASGKSCFHGNSLVETNLGQMKMEDLATSTSEDLLIKTENSFQKIQNWIHKDPQQVAEFVSITTKQGRSLTLTPNHLIYKVPCNGQNERQTVLAANIQTGDCLLIDNENSLDEVSSIEKSVKNWNIFPNYSRGKYFC